MTVTVSKPNLKRLLCGLSVAAVLLWIHILLLYRQRVADGILEQWLDLARENAVVSSLSIQCDVPWLRTNNLAKQLLGKFRVHVAAMHTEDVQAILNLPECPVPLTVSALRGIPEEEVEKLRDRFGAENVN